MCWPSPVRSFWMYAEAIAKASWTPVPLSPTNAPGLMGGPSGSPVIENEPAAFWAMTSKLL